MKRLGHEKADLLRQIQRFSEMLQGSLVRLYRKCGKKGFRCERGPKHGSAYYLSFKEGGVTQMVYVPAFRLEEVKESMEAFSRYCELGVKLSQVNLEQMGLRRRDVREKRSQDRFFDHYVYDRHLPTGSGVESD